MSEANPGPPLVALPCLTDDRASPRLAAVLADTPDAPVDRARYSLAWSDDGRLALFDLAEPKNRPLAIDWVSELRAMRSYPATRKDPLGRALGRKTKRVIDATAGFGGDSGRMMMMGYAVDMIEQTPVIAALLLDALARLEIAADIAARLAAPPTVCCADAVLALPSLDADCVFIDPMFPPRPKSSVLSKRPLRVLGELAASSATYEDLVTAARAASARRIVVKRPDHIKAPVPAPDETVAGKLVRYDIYFPR